MMPRAKRKEPEMSRAEWLERRRHYIGASEAAAALGMSPWMTRLELCRDKWGERVDEKTEVMERGTVLEPLVGELYRRATGNSTIPGQWIVSKDHDFMAATPDLNDIADDVLVQCKTASTWVRDQWGGKPDSPDPMNVRGIEIPQQYQIQCQHEMSVTGAKEDRIAVLWADQSTFRGLVWMVKAGMKIERVADYVGDLIADASSLCEFRVIPVTRSDPAIEVIVAGEKDFWEKYVIPHVEPPDASIPEKSSEIIEADSDDEILLHRLRSAKEAQNLAEAEYKELVEQVKTRIGEKAGIAAEGIATVSYKAPAPRRDIDYEAAVAQVRRKKLADPSAAIDSHTVPVTDWAAVWREVRAVDEEKMAKVEDQFATITQGARRFMPRFAKE